MSALTNSKKPVKAINDFFQILLENQRAVSILQIVLASCFIGICAQIKIPLYFTPVPLSVQTLAVMLIGATLGSRKGALAVLCYLLQGWMGLPVFAGGAAGVFYFVGPTGGYLTALVAQAYFIGWCLERDCTMGSVKIVSVLLLSICIQLGVGSLWLAQYVGIKHCFALGFSPFVCGEAAKALMVAAYVNFKKYKST
ncbi:MAG: biotin transporter BioY [Parachlamydiaceae bacterium]